MTDEDPRCCGSGTCIIDPAGRCWCGQQWNGKQMSHQPLARAMSQPEAQPCINPVSRAPAPGATRCGPVE